MANYTLESTSGGTEYYEGSGVFDGNSNGKDHITGSDGVDTINAGNGDDVLIGLGGNDILTGGNGDDTFQYFYTMTSSSAGSKPQSYADYLDSMGLEASSLTQNEHSTSYSAWLNYLVFGGEDSGGNTWGGLVEHFGWEGEVTVGLNQNGSDDSQPHIKVDGVMMDLDAIFGSAQSLTWTKGKATQERSFWDLDGDYDWGGGTTVSSGDGKDTITDFRKGDDEDILAFTVDIEGDSPVLTEAEKGDLIAAFKAEFDVSTGDFNSDGNTDTLMTLDSGMSITLLGYAGGEEVWDHVEFAFV